MSVSVSKVGVCFVCLGNICRSPTAEAVFARDVRAAGLSERVFVDSAGTGDWHVGELAHPRTRSVAAQRGLEITHRARLLVREDFARFDLIVVMDRSNQANASALAPDRAAVGRIRLFREFDPEAEHGAEVPDPYHTGEFERVLDICERSSRGLLEVVRERYLLG